VSYSHYLSPLVIDLLDVVPLYVVGWSNMSLSFM